MSVLESSAVYEPSRAFQPSFPATSLSRITAPRTMIALTTLSVTMLMGASLPISVVTTGAALLTQKFFIKVISGGDVLRSSVFTGAEHISKIDIQGGLPIITIPPLYDVLNKMGYEDAVVAKNCLESILNYENHFDYIGINNSVLVSDLIEKEDIYDLAEKLPYLSTEQAKEYEHVMIHMLYLDNPIGSEAIELYAGATIIFSNLRKKISGGKVNYDEVQYLQASSYLKFSMNEYRLLRLNKEFPGSPWIQSIFDFYLKSQRAPINFDPMLGDSMKALLET